MVATDDQWCVYVGGSLIGTFKSGERVTRDVLLVGLAQDPRTNLGNLATAFDVAVETLRQLRALYARAGVEGIVTRRGRGAPPKLNARLRERLDRAFSDGATVSAAHAAIGRKVSRSLVGLARLDWAARAGATGEPQATGPGSEAQSRPELVPAPSTPPPASSPDSAPSRGPGSAADDGVCPEVGEFGAGDPASHGDEPTVGGNAAAASGSEDSVAPIVGLVEEIASPTPPEGREQTSQSSWAEVDDDKQDRPRADDADKETRLRPLAAQSRKGVQHLGTWLMIAVLESMGLYREFEAICGSAGRFSFGQARIAIDAIVVVLATAQRCVEAVRRLATSTAFVLLRATHAPSAPWVRSCLGSLAREGGGERVQLGMTLEYLEAAKAVSQAGERCLFYVDNHLRPYTGKKVIRKGWRMQDKRARPGITDYYVHDRDGRPVMRMDVPTHDPLTAWLSPLAELLRKALGPGETVLLAFDRAGAFPEQLAELRDDGFEFVTYERRPYPVLGRPAFDQVFIQDGEEVRFHEQRLKNLGNGRGRVRRIAILTDAGRQVNLLAVSTLPVPELYAIMRGRWGQENGFKHGNQRWGINQLDGRTTDRYPPDAIIPDPMRRRLDEALRIEREREGTARRHLAHLGPDAPARARWQADLNDALRLQREFEGMRPAFPTHAAVRNTELADVLVQHRGEYKTLIDTVRIAAANAESELACILAQHLRRPREAKQVLLNVMKAAGAVQVSASQIKVVLEPAGTKDELRAISLLLEKCTEWRLTLPGDSSRRPLRFEIQS